MKLHLKFCFNKIVKIVFLLLTGSILNYCDSTPEFQNGDIIFQTSLSSQSKALQIATKSKYSHMGMIFINDDAVYVYEAVQPVKLTPIDDWIKRGEDGHFVVKRLKDYKSVLTPEVLKRMKQYGETFKGKNYDLYFEWSDESIYCSELVWKIYKETTGIKIGSLQRMKDFDLSHPLVQAKIKERYGDDIPLNELVISPASIFESSKLYTVYSK